MPDKISGDGYGRRFRDMGTGGDGLSSFAEIVATAEAGASSNGAGTSRSGTIATGGTAQVLAAANAARRFIKGQNISGYDLWINELGGTAAADTVDSFVVPPRATFRIDTTRAVSIVGAVTGQKFTALEV